MRAALLALLAFASPLRANDVGTHVEFAGQAFDGSPSAPISADFTGLLIQGRFEGPAAAVEASVLSGGAWGPWIEAAGESTAKGRFWMKVLIAGKKGDSVRLRTAATVELFGVYATNFEEERPSDGAFRKMSAPIPAGSAPKPEVQPRAAWGALPAAKPYSPMTPERITIHHTEGAQPLSRESAIDELQATQRFHQNGRGWIDMAYHYLIDGGGRIWEGRPMAVVGAHVKEKNDGNVGISMMGDFSKGKKKPTVAQIASLTRLTRWLSATYAIPADRIKGHRDQEITECPGDALYIQLDELRRATAASSDLYASTRRAGIVLREPAW